MKRKKTGRPPGVRSVSFWFPQPLIARLDRHAKRLTELTGFPVSRSAAVKLLIETGLDREESPGLDNGPVAASKAPPQPKPRMVRKGSSKGQESPPGVRMGITGDWGKDGD